jgi:hypothetical protein
MHYRIAWPMRLIVLSCGVFLALALTRAQEPKPDGETKVAPPKAAISATTADKTAQEFAKLSPLHKQFWLSAQRGAEWLYRANGPDGRFTYGVVPALRTALEGDHYLRQAGAAAALAKIAQFTGDPRYAARATQAVVTLLADTSQDSQDSQLRYTVFPPASVNRLAAAGLLVLAIHELPEPDRDLLAKAEQLCNYIHKQQQGDGSLSCSGGIDGGKPSAADAEAVNFYPGEALVGIIRSQRRAPAAWKIDFVRNALAFYKTWWRQHPSMAFVPWQTAAYTEAFLLTKEQPFADFVYEMNDWIVGLQYQGFDDPKQVYWSGGFKSWADGKAADTPPQISSAFYAEGLAEACRVARALGDLNRHRTYTAALERCLTFLIALQYTEENTRHFADWYRPTLVGGFHASHQDGDLRIDYTQHAVSAMIQHLTYVARVQ